MKILSTCHESKGTTQTPVSFEETVFFLPCDNTAEKNSDLCSK